MDENEVVVETPAEVVEETPTAEELEATNVPPVEEGVDLGEHPGEVVA